MTTYLGYSQDDKKYVFAKYFDETNIAISDDVKQALVKGPLPANTLLTLADINKLSEGGYGIWENGYAAEADHSIVVSVLTPMPDVLPKMWDWWFGWHGSDSARYKLWHPKAHLSARWSDGADNEAYIGRTSLIEEYIGKKKESAAIQFIDPKNIGINDNNNNTVYICARLGYAIFPLDFGYLVHQIRSTSHGAEMRSRFFLGGPHIALRSHNFFAKIVSVILQKVVRLPTSQGANLLQHCSEEMGHLAKFLPNLYSEFNKK
jgi:hypothetical protein